MSAPAYEITRHAATRWVERTGLRDAAAAREAWDRAWATVGEVFLKKEHKVKALLNHHFQDARYFRSEEGWVFVVADGKVVTVHANTADKYVLPKRDSGLPKKSRKR